MLNGRYSVQIQYMYIICLQNVWVKRAVWDARAYKLKQKNPGNATNTYTNRSQRLTPRGGEMDRNYHMRNKQINTREAHRPALSLFPNRGGHNANRTKNTRKQGARQLNMKRPVIKHKATQNENYTKSNLN